MEKVVAAAVSEPGENRLEPCEDYTQTGADDEASMIDQRCW